MSLIAPSIKGLQRLLTITEQYCFEWDIMLNPKKSQNMEFGQHNDRLPALLLDGKELEWVKSLTYLGVTILSHKQFNCCVA